jgi:dGTPase
MLSAAVLRPGTNSQRKININRARKSRPRSFEGNAQGFRILTRLEMQPRTGWNTANLSHFSHFYQYPRESLISTDILNGYAGKSAKKTWILPS